MAGDLLPILVVVAVVGGVGGWLYHRHRRLREGLDQLVARDGLVRTDRPCGLERRQLAGRFDATPTGARRNGLRHGVQGTSEVALDGHPVRVEVACFQWWYEEMSQNDQGTSYQERATTVAIARLPVVVPGRVQVRPEGVLGRVGLRRADQQLESEEFNRRFHVRGSDPRLTVQFLDAAMQHRLLTTVTGRTLHLEGDLLVLGGRPSHRDASLPGVIGELPAVAQDAVGLLAAVPAQVWRTASPVSETGGDP
jgi:hypothetical protein